MSRGGGWTTLALLLAAVVSLPVLAVLSHVGADTDGLWAHLADTVLGTYLLNTAGLLAGVAVGASVLGVSTAWLVATCDFPGRRFFPVLLMLPLAMPTYLMAYTWADLLQFTGPVQTGLREAFGWQRGDYWFPQVRSLPGAIVVLSGVLYPYVFLLARAAFAEQSARAVEAGRALGAGAWRSFASLALPLARPAVAAGLALALMETLAEYGAVQHLAVDTFTTGIYRAWMGLGSPAASSQLASVLLLFVLALIAAERLGRGRARYDASTASTRPLRPARLRGLRAAAAWTACALPVAVGFVVPALALLAMALGAETPLRGAGELAGNTVAVAALTAGLVVAAGLVIAYGLRLRGGRLLRVAARLAGSGYAVPGSVVAVGVLVAVGAIDDALDTWIGGTLAALVLAYAVRFLAVSIQSFESGLSRIHRSVDDAARSLGAGPGRLLGRVHLPLLRGSLLSATLLVFVDVMKELPATLIVRPFDFDTLAVHVHNYASDERLAQAAAPALLIVAVGLLPVVLLSRSMERAR